MREQFTDLASLILHFTFHLRQPWYEKLLGKLPEKQCVIFCTDHLRKGYLPCLPERHGNDLKELLKDCFRLGLIAEKTDSEGHLRSLCYGDDFILC